MANNWIFNHIIGFFGRKTRNQKSKWKIHVFNSFKPVYIWGLSLNINWSLNGFWAACVANCNILIYSSFSKNPGMVLPERYPTMKTQFIIYINAPLLLRCDRGIQTERTWASENMGFIVTCSMGCIRGSLSNCSTIQWFMIVQSLSRILKSESGGLHG